MSAKAMHIGPIRELTRAKGPKLLLIYTGGTIGMTQKTPDGPLVPFDFSHLIENVPKIAKLNLSISHVEFEPPIDSSCANTEFWAHLATLVYTQYSSFDGFVILHGTDTMAYTASALSFMLQNLAKPVILTGSQLPIGEIREDGTENVITALQIAGAQDPTTGEPMVQEVAISFGRNLWRGNRATKKSSTNFGAFRSYNFPALANMDLHIVFHPQFLMRHTTDAPLALQSQLSREVNVLPIWPGIQEAQVEAVLFEPHTRACILRTFGAGNAPTYPWFTRALEKAHASGKVLVNVTQCPAGGVEEARYATGDALLKAGVISGQDMTFEATLTKLMYLLAHTKDQKEVELYMQKNIAGELGSPQSR